MASQASFMRVANITLAVGLTLSTLGYAAYHWWGATGLLGSIGEFVSDVFFPLESLEGRMYSSLSLFDRNYKDGEAKLYKPACVPCPTVHYDRRSTVGYAAPADQRKQTNDLSGFYDRFGWAGWISTVHPDVFKSFMPDYPVVWEGASKPENALTVPVRRAGCTPIGGAATSYRGATADPLAYMANILCGQHQQRFIDFVRGKATMPGQFNPREHYNKALFPKHTPFFIDPKHPVSYATSDGNLVAYNDGYHYKQQSGLGGRATGRRVLIPPCLSEGNGRAIPVNGIRPSGDTLKQAGYLAFYYPQGSDPTLPPRFTYAPRGGDKPVTQWSEADIRRYCQLFLSTAEGPWAFQSVAWDGSDPTSVLGPVGSPK